LKDIGAFGFRSEERARPSFALAQEAIEMPALAGRRQDATG
jgi:hypothetical protein